ncbi:hypothetical protein LX32DRAFT_731260 [Colletotrichum zoysiae]|uniref:Xylanolytic transcriptional activator regulatory domain-containing protein n=1 Tax=Colletotrichum zoysiae TaxID=1216348 RepID=A0AAD9H958_9PEZI|nr:hypothetical protein LX32DRAFT_731260 [Colletotrichum zoysiae]
MNLDLDVPALTFALPPTELPPRPEEDAPPGVVSFPSSLPAEHLAQLHDVFFQEFSPALPVIAKAGFYRRLAEFPDSPSTRSISYSVALLGTVVSEQHRHRWKSCYTLARQYVDECEQDDAPDSLASISLLQALICLTRFDLGRRNCARAHINLGRAARLASMMQLEQMDHVQPGTGLSHRVSSALQIKLQATHDLVDLEERRRCFWGLYILEGYASIHSGTFSAPSHTNLFAFLPCPGALDDTFNPQPMPYVDGVQENNTPDTISPFAGLSIVVWIIGQVLKHASRAKLGEPGFRDCHYALVKTIQVNSAVLKPLFSLRTLYSDAVALDVYLSFQAVTMLLYQTSLRQGEQQGIASDNILVSDTKKALRATALRVASTVKSMWSMQKKNFDNLSLSGPFVAWPLSLAIQVLRQDVLEGDDDYVEHIHMLHRSLGDVEYTDGLWHRQVEGSYRDGPI